MKRWIFLPVLFLALLAGSTAFAADFQKGLDAALKDDFATALREFTPLAASVQSTNIVQAQARPREDVARVFSMEDTFPLSFTPIELPIDQAKARRIKAIALFVVATVAIVVIVIVIVLKTRRWIAATISSGWRRQSKEFRAWAFGSFFWAMGTFLFVALFNPYGGYMRDEDVWHMFTMMILPPLFLGAAWFGYKRFVD